jgi:hypothetical protein
MASNLPLSPKLLDAFREANDSKSPVRFLTVDIENEELILSKLVNRERHVSSDFDTILKPMLANDKTSIIIFKIDENKWVLIAWSPDSANVKDKMLSASVRETCKKALVNAGGNFEPDYAVSEEAEMLWKAYITRFEERRDPNLMTEAERDMAETKKAEAVRKAELTSTSRQVDKSVGVIPFSVADECRDALKTFAGEKETLSFMEMAVENEVISLAGVKNPAEGDKLEGLVSNTDARFLLIRTKSKEGAWKVLFCFSCPDDVNVRTKMVLSSSKATVMQKVVAEGIVIDENLEIRGADEIDDAIDRKLAPATVLEAVGAAAASSGAARPKAKGRAATKKVAKFVADDD